MLALTRCRHVWPTEFPDGDNLQGTRQHTGIGTATTARKWDAHLTHGPAGGTANGKVSAELLQHSNGPISQKRLMRNGKPAPSTFWRGAFFSQPPPPFGEA